MKTFNWDIYFMALAFVIAQRSPDENTKHGAIIVNNNNRILGTGYNGHPSGGNNDDIYDWSTKEKHEHCLHAELNAVLNCTQPPIDATIYITGRPCNKCALAIIQSGIKTVNYGPIECRMDINWDKTVELFWNHNIRHRYVSGVGPDNNNLVETILEEAKCSHKYYLNMQENK